MIKPELYKKTCDILFDAYFNDTLQHDNCYACAVGNIVAANLGCTVLFLEDRKTWGNKIPCWDEVFITVRGKQRIAPSQFTGESKIQIDSTGYTYIELAKIEYAFESASKGKSEEDYMYNGLVAVLEVLKQIHQVEDDNEVERFSKHYHSKLHEAIN